MLQSTPNGGLTAPLLPSQDSRPPVTFTRLRVEGGNFAPDDPDLHRALVGFARAGVDIRGYIASLVVTRLSEEALQPGTEAWWQENREAYIKDAKLLIDIDATGRKFISSRYPDLTTEVHLYFRLKSCIMLYDRYSKQPTLEEQDLRNQLGILYDKYAEKFAIAKDVEIKHMLAEVQDFLQQRKYAQACERLKAATLLLLQCEAKFMPTTAFRDPNLFNSTLETLAITARAYTQSLHQEPRILAKTLVKAALGYQSLFWAHEERLLNMLTTHFSLNWSKFFGYHPPSQRGVKLIAQLLQTTLSKEIIRVIQDNIVEIDYSNWVCRGGLFYCNTKQMHELDSLLFVLSNMIVDAPSNDFTIRADFLELAETADPASRGSESRLALSPS